MAEVAIDRRGGMVHLRRKDGSCAACIEGAAFMLIEQALREEWMAAAQKVAQGEGGSKKHE